MKLTPRQHEVLGLLGRGMSNEEIAQALGIAPGTAKLHVGAVLRELGVRTRLQAGLKAQQLAAAPDALTPEELAWCQAHPAEVRALIAGTGNGGLTVARPGVMPGEAAA